jgi:hypothetical protein
MFHFTPKLPMRNKRLTVDYYKLLGFTVLADYGDYLLMEAEGSELHFFAHPLLDPDQNYGQVYIKTSEVEALYRSFQAAGIAIHPNAPLERKPWGMLEFSLLDPDKNLLTFGTAI